MYYIWKNIVNDDEPDLLDSTHINIKIHPTYFTHSGLKIPEDFPLIKFLIDDQNNNLQSFDSLWGGFPYLVFSRKLKTCLTQIGIKNIQYFPALIEDAKTNSIFDSFSVVNILGLVQCLDWNRALFVKEDDLQGYVSRIDRLIVDLDKIPSDMLIFRLSELSSHILCHEKIVTALEGQIIGVQFLPAI